MSDFPSVILKKYGTPAFIFAFVLAGMVWSLAHIAAAPGGEVSVLWGLVKYTKKEPNMVSTNPSNIQKNDAVLPNPKQDEIVDLLIPLSLSITHNISDANITSTLSKLREERKLRELSVSESGKKINEIPKGTYFFTLGVWVESEYKWVKETKVADFLTPFNSLKTWRIRSSDSDLEIHCPDTGTCFLILYITEQTASQISHLDGKTEHTVMAAIYPWGVMNSMVSVPVDRIIKTKDREVQISENENATVFDLVLK